MHYQLLSVLTEEEWQGYRDSIQKVYEMSFCNHDSGTKLMVKITSNGQSRYYLVCLGCGEKRTVKRGELTSAQISKSTPYDDKLIKSLQEPIKEIRSAEIAKAESVYVEIAEARQAVQQDRYNQYLLSDEWKSKREIVIKRCGGICQGCGINKVEHIHHLTYERLFDEMLFDLVGVCRSCHQKIHPEKAITSPQTVP